MKKFPISIYKWEKYDYCPPTWGEVKLTDKTLYIKMTSLESNPFARYTHGPDAKVCCDSCVEFFFSFNNLQPAYLNIEMNSIGGYYCAYHPELGVKEYCSPFAEGGAPKATVLDDMWYAEATFDLDTLKKFFGLTEVTSFAANFYKCGDETEKPHYGMHNEVIWEQPSFHRPEFFVNIPLEDVK